MILNPTLACANPLNLKSDIDELLAGGAKMLHVDLMDGHYVPNLCLNLDQLKAVRSYAGIPVDAHLMVTNPFDYIDRLAAAGADYASFHIDSTPFAVRMINCLREKGIRPGVVLNPSQPVSLLEELLPRVDYVLLMGVEPGFSGQSFLPETYGRLRQLDTLRKEKGLEFFLMVDGGIDHENGRECAKMGADVLVGGAFVCFGQPDGVRASSERFLAAVSE